MRDQLRISVLGLPRVELSNRNQVVFVSARAQAILIYLAVMRQPHSREELSLLFWPDRPLALARHNLSDALSKLRPLFGQWLTINRHSISFNLNAPVWMDLLELENNIRLPAVAVDQQANSPGITLDALRDLLHLAQGEFLEGFFVEGANEFEEWVSTQRLHCKSLLQQGLLRLLRLSIEQDLPDSVADAAQRLIKNDPLHEEANHQMLLWLANSNQRTAAIQHYQKYEQLLDTELGIKPSADFEAIYQRLLDRNEAAHAVKTVDSTVAPSALPPRSTVQTADPINLHNLPRSMTPFLGRSEEIKAIRDWLRSPNNALVSIVGEGGIGKSRLALAVCAEMLHLFTDGVWFVPLVEIEAGETAESRIGAAIGRAIHLDFDASTTVKEQLLTYLQQRNMLLVLDNFEHLIGKADFVLQLLRVAPQLKLIITSRQSLNLLAELVLRLEGLPTPPSLPAEDTELEKILAYDSVGLFIERVRRVAWRFHPNPSNINAITRICRYVEGMPLAIELAASLIENLSVQEIDRRLRDDYKILASSRIDFEPRQRSIATLLDYSWQFLTVAERQTMMRCALFSGGFSDEAATAVAGASIASLDLLQKKSLLRRDDTGRYDMHELVRQHANEKFDSQNSERERILNRHCAYFINFLFERQSSLGNDPVPYGELSLELANFQHAWQHALTRALLPLLRQGRQALFTYYALAGLSYEAESLLRQAIARVGVILTPGLDFGRSDADHDEWIMQWRLLQAELTIDLAHMCELLGKLEEAEKLTSSAIAIGERIHSPSLLAQAQLRASANAWARGNYDAHRNALTAALQLAQSTDQFFIEATALCGLGNNDLLHDRREQALGFYVRALQIADRHGYRQLENKLVSNTGVLHQLQGSFTQANQSFQRALEVSRLLGDRDGVALAHVNLGVLLNLLGKHVQAGEQLALALENFREIGSQRMEADVLVYLALTQHYLGDQAGAIAFCQQAMALDQTHQLAHIIRPAHLNLGRAYEALGQNDKARAEYQTVIELHAGNDVIKDSISDALIAHCGLARLALVENNLSEASAQAEQVLVRLNKDELHAGLDEMAVYLTLYHVLRARDDERTSSILQQATQRLHAQIAQIDDAQTRLTFVEQVPVRRELLALAAGTKNRSAAA